MAARYNIISDSTLKYLSAKRSQRIYLLLLLGHAILTTVELFFIVYFHDYKLLTDCKCR